MGHLNSFSASGGGNLNKNFAKNTNARGLPGRGCWSFDLTGTLYPRGLIKCWRGAHLWFTGWWAYNQRGLEEAANGMSVCFRHRGLYNRPVAKTRSWLCTHLIWTEKRQRTSFDKGSEGKGHCKSGRQWRMVRGKKPNDTNLTCHQLSPLRRFCSRRIDKQTDRQTDIRTDEGLTLETSAFESHYGGQII